MTKLALVSLLFEIFKNSHALISLHQCSDLTYGLLLQQIIIRSPVIVNSVIAGNRNLNNSTVFILFPCIILCFIAFLDSRYTWYASLSDKLAYKLSLEENLNKQSGRNLSTSY